MKSLVLLALVVTCPLFANEIRWTRIDLNLTYADTNMKCDNLNVEGKPIEDGGFFLALELQGDQVVRAQLNNYPNVFPYNLALYRATQLTQAEITKITTYKDPKGQLWLKTWELNERLLKWIGTFTTMNALLCEVPKPLNSATPANVTFEFETDGLAKGIEISYSKWNSIESKLNDPHKYKMDLQFVQKTAHEMGL